MPKKMIADRKDVADEDKWVLTPLFETDEDWEQLFSNAEKEIGFWKTKVRSAEFRIRELKDDD